MCRLMTGKESFFLSFDSSFMWREQFQEELLILMTTSFYDFDDFTVFFYPVHFHPT